VFNHLGPGQLCCRGDIELFISHISVRYCRILLSCRPLADHTSLTPSLRCRKTLLWHANSVLHFHCRLESNQPPTPTSALAFSPQKSQLNLTSSPSGCCHPSSTHLSQSQERLSTSRHRATTPNLTSCNHGVAYHSSRNCATGQSLHLSRVSVVPWRCWGSDTALI
jgi:hypothetical protein